MNDEFKPKTFWERPEGTMGMAVIGLGALFATFVAGPYLIKVFDIAITLLGQGIAITVLGAILTALIMVLSNKKFQALMGYVFKSAMRKFTGAWIEIDPIGIMKSYIDDLTDKRETMNVSIGKLRGQISVCEKQVNQNDAEYNSEMTKFKIATEKKMGSAATVAGRQAMRLEKLNKTSLVPLLNQMKVHLKALMKYYEVTGTVIEDLGNEVKAQETQRKLIAESWSAMNTAKKILQGGTDQKEIFDQAMEYVVNDYGMKMGEIENFIENSKGFVEGLDLQNAVFDEEALKKLQEWEHKGDSILLGNEKVQMLEQTTAYHTIQHGIGAPASVDYAELINRK